MMTFTKLNRLSEIKSRHAYNRVEVGFQKDRSDTTFYSQTKTSFYSVHRNIYYVIVKTILCRSVRHIDNYRVRYNVVLTDSGTIL